MAAYWISRCLIKDAVQYKKYTDLVPAIIAAHGGRVLARGGRYQIMEGPETFQRFVVIEFPTLEAGRDCFLSPEYRAAAGHRRGGAGVVENVIVEGGEATMSHVFTPRPVVSVPVLGRSETFPVHRIYCVGRNYEEHAKEMGFTGREPPFFFLKPADAALVVPAGETGTLPYPSLTKNLHHEIELVVAIGSGGKNISAANAHTHIFGYAVGLDMTRRDLQGEAKKQGRPWCTGKGFDHSAPIGPITPVAQAGDIVNAAISLQVNGQPRQGSHIHKLIWNIAETIEHLSAAWELMPGDLIYTGTPEGVNAVVAGDLMVGSVSGLGELRVKVL